MLLGQSWLGGRRRMVLALMLAIGLVWASMAAVWAAQGSPWSGAPRTSAAKAAVLVVPPADQVYYPVTPARLVDTRIALGLPGKLHTKVPQTFQVTGLGGVPANATAVTGNVTVVGATARGYVSVGPAPIVTPTTSTLNFPVNDTRANAVTMTLGSDGTLSATFVGTGTPDLLFDVTGYFAPAVHEFHPVVKWSFEVPADGSSTIFSSTVFPAGTVVSSVTANITAVDSIPSGCQAIVLIEGVEGAPEFLAAWFYADITGPTPIAANAYLPRSSSALSAAGRIRLLSGTCYDGTDPVSAHPVPGFPHVTGNIVFNISEGPVAIP